MIINCFDTSGCARLHIRGTPHIALVIGNEWKYWPPTRERGAEGWDRWINQTIAHNLRKIETDEELEAAQKEPKDGGTTFLLDVPSENDSSIAILRNHSKLFRHYNDTFVYRVRKDIENAQLSAFRKPGCPIYYNGNMKDMYQFLQRNRFGLYHRYQYVEYLSMTAKERSAIFVVEKKLSKVQHHSLGILGSNECSDIEYGWASLDDNEKFSRLPGALTEVPFLYVKDKDGEDQIWFKSLRKARTELIPEIRHAKKIRNHEHGDKEENMIKMNKSIKKYVMYVLSVLYGMVTYVIIINVYKLVKGNNQKNYNHLV